MIQLFSFVESKIKGVGVGCSTVSPTEIVLPHVAAYAIGLYPYRHKHLKKN
jgi:hypothetical protein